MEPLWSPVVATSGNRWQASEAEKRPKQAKTVAVGCHRLRLGAHGKEGVCGSSPKEGFAKVPYVGAFHSGRFAPRRTCGRSGALVEPSGQRRRQNERLSRDMCSATYVTDVTTAMARAKEAAGDKNVLVHGAGVAQLALAAGALDERELHMIPVFFGQGRRLSRASLLSKPSCSAPGSSTARPASPTCITASCADGHRTAFRPDRDRPAQLLLRSQPSDRTEVAR
jgi:hypothetical protein